MSIEVINGKTYDIWPEWKNLPKDYVCPSCKREKKHIARENRHGHIMLHISAIGICQDCISFPYELKKEKGLDLPIEEAMQYASVFKNCNHIVSDCRLCTATVCPSSDSEVEQVKMDMECIK